MRSLPVSNPTTRFDKVAIEFDDGLTPEIELEVIDDHSRTILSKNDSPDIGFDFSVNPYRGCFHGCAYCYARPSHEYLSLGAGTDFERRIVVKRDAPTLLRQALRRSSWKGDRIVFSGVTDCYQPLEGKLHLMRGCLEVCLERKNAIGIITKSTLIERDVDLLVELAKVASVTISISIPFMDLEHSRALEPFVAPPERRFRTVERLAKAGLQVGVSVSPIIPGLNDESIGKVLEAAKKAGARHAFYSLLRLPGPVAQIFEQRLREKLPLRAERVLGRIRQTRGGKMYQPGFGERQHGTGQHAEMIDALFESAKRRFGIGDEPWPMRGPSPRREEIEDTSEKTKTAAKTAAKTAKSSAQLDLFR